MNSLAELWGVDVQPLLPMEISCLGVFHLSSVPLFAYQDSGPIQYIVQRVLKHYLTGTSNGRDNLVSSLKTLTLTNWNLETFLYYLQLPECLGEVQRTHVSKISSQ